MDIQFLLSFILHLGEHLTEFVNNYGTLTYILLFSVIFAETGLVVAPFLPGDSLLFAAGSVSALGDLNIWFLVLILIVAAILGDSVNYMLGYYFGKKIVDNPHIPFINQEHIDKTEQFYKKHGGKTILLARFVPVIRTFAPFVAGVGKMHYQQFAMYNIVGGILWVTLFTFAGYLFGNIPWVKTNFHIVVFLIIGISFVPIFIEYIKAKRTKNVPGIKQETLEEVVNE